MYSSSYDTQEDMNYDTRSSHTRNDEEIEVEEIHEVAQTRTKADPLRLTPNSMYSSAEEEYLQEVVSVPSKKRSPVKRQQISTPPAG